MKTFVLFASLRLGVTLFAPVFNGRPLKIAIVRQIEGYKDEVVGFSNGGNLSIREGGRFARQGQARPFNGMPFAAGFV